MAFFPSCKPASELRSEKDEKDLWSMTDGPVKREDWHRYCNI